jgi:hypothetical protein
MEIGVAEVVDDDAMGFDGMGDLIAGEADSEVMISIATTEGIKVAGKTIAVDGDEGEASGKGGFVEEVMEKLRTDGMLGVIEGVGRKLKRWKRAGVLHDGGDVAHTVDGMASGCAAVNEGGAEPEEGFGIESVWAGFGLEVVFHFLPPAGDVSRVGTLRFWPLMNGCPPKLM